jgi:signal transduction histidine kinase
MVHLTLLDTGQGVPDSVRAYFLKQVVPQGKEGVGTGMGALIARFVALNHGGELSLIKSRPDEGTELLMTLPVAVDKNEAPANGGGK